MAILYINSIRTKHDYEHIISKFEAKDEGLAAIVIYDKQTRVKFLNENRINQRSIKWLGTLAKKYFTDLWPNALWVYTCKAALRVMISP